MSLFSRVDTMVMYQPFFERLRAVIAECAAKGADYWAVSGFRSYAEQEKLFAQGRSMPGARVTNAMAGESPHNFAIACDFVCDGYLDRTGGLQPDYRPASYDMLGAVAKRHGLEWGGSWAGLQDRPHVQWPGFVTSRELQPLRQAYETGGLISVFKFLDSQEAQDARFS